ncbi:MAG: RNA pyrophosphohydrolase [Alphaproteobacteria bacterium MarineAlpha6_Bin4]|nr:MAG: RNA pyrophosphohydrolase [Alphaproteobacteria bacterium MarineAlpha6_Bin4]|tara:strand:+ start:1373 stop:1852 length:480 start_codon:yes stop_codon:yes gene_type:complete
MININSYRVGVGILLFNEKKKIFVGKRIDFKSEAWQMPQGGITKGEKLKDAAYRELYEETGIKKAKIIFESKKWYKYSIPKYIKKKLWKGKYLGQKQKWFLMKFKGDEKKDINLNIHKAEFCDWKWVNIEDLEKIIVPFKKKMYKEIVKEFKNKIKKIT